MKEDILEQVVEDWLLSHPSTFCRHNVKFRPDSGVLEYNHKKDSSYSDIDVIGIHLKNSGVDRVSAVSCKSWQEGFNPGRALDTLLNNPEKISGGRPFWKAFRELANKKWGQAFARKVYSETLSKDFTYYLFVTKLVGTDIEKEKSDFEHCQRFIDNLKFDNDSKVVVKILSFKEMYKKYYQNNITTTLEATDLGRFMQIVRASGLKINLD
jgi:hypothetical protein